MGYDEYLTVIVFGIGITLTLIFKNYDFLIIPSLGIPIILGYLGRKENILAKSQIFERDTILMIALIAFIVVILNYMIDPRIGLLVLGLIMPIIFAIKG
ncbi:hypothetical protein [Pyrococcus horikoshii]|uniref:Uncharacterized protein n=1 Tax=Pyrococcus horikoshii TaxID=53953 RepID=A0A832T2X7_PYRHR|nr:hypothetical protein [Pyrococcus horikoshii]HII60311.1 hypothetical protein [Pyrococcus horikoshii]